jgi:pimeloyl-ACP methyl ester carboxylesterase
VKTILNSILRLIWGIADLLTAPTSVVRVPLPADIARITPKDAGLTFQEVLIPTELGVCPAWWVPSWTPDQEVDPEKWVIFVHGRGGDRVGSIDMLPLMHRLGYNSLVITYRNDRVGPKSPDGRDHLGATEWRDLEDAVAFAVDMGASEVTLFGRSAGGAIIGQFLTRSMDSFIVDKVILDNPVLDWEPVFLKAAPRWMPRWVGRLVIWANMRLIGARTKQFNLVDYPPLHRPPTLILHATADDTCPVQVSRRVVEMRPGSWNVVLVETEGGHEGGRFADPDTYLTMVQAWLYPERWDKTLLAEPVAEMPRVSA